MKIITQSVFDKWPLENESVQTIICSPPYYQKRVYDIPNSVIGGNKECDHILNESNFCTKCNAWIGQYGNEASFQQFIYNSLLWCKEAYRVLKPNGLFFLNIGSSYLNNANNYEEIYELKDDLTEGDYKYVMKELSNENLSKL